MSNIDNTGTTIDSSFFLPPGLIDMRYKDSDTDSSSTVRGNEAFTATPSAFEVGWEDAPTQESIPDVSNTLPIPDSVTFISQTVRIGPGGGTVVDVVLEVQDFPGISEYGVRLSKI